MPDSITGWQDLGQDAAGRPYAWLQPSFWEVGQHAAPTLVNTTVGTKEIYRAVESDTAVCPGQASQTYVSGAISLLNYNMHTLSRST